MSKGKNYGNVYEIKLSNNKYVYVCWIRDVSFGVFDYYLEEPTSDIDKLLSKGVKIFKACKETAIRKKIWQLVGHINIEEQNIEWPDLAIYMYLDPERFIENSRVMRNGNPQVIEKDKYLELVEKGYIYGFFDKYETFERWLVEHMENYPEGVKW